LQAIAALWSKKIAKYGGKWDFLGQTVILLTSYLFLTALNFSPNRPHSTAKFALLKIKFLQFRLRIKI
jgi:hypothetical protein